RSAEGRPDLHRQDDPQRRADRGCRGVPCDPEGVAMSGRRKFLAGAAAIAVLPMSAARATPEAMAAAIQEVVKGATVREGRVKLDLPPLVENGNTVPLTVVVESPMTEADHVRAIHVFNEKNPQPHVFSARLGPRNGRATIATRIKL